MAWTDPRIERKKAREEQARVAGIFGETYFDEAGVTHSYAALAPVALEAQPQLEFKLGGYSKNHVIRQRLADNIEAATNWEFEKTSVIDCEIEHTVSKLRNARLSGTCGIRKKNGKPIFYWDNKAGLSRLCPDDAREDSMRLQRKHVPEIVRLQAQGYGVHYSVLTMRNAEQTKLREGMDSICLRLKKLLKRFPEITGCLSVLEAPLGPSRDWHIHLNCIFIVQGGYLDYEKVREFWHYNAHFEKLKEGPEIIRAALAELIKYAVAATVAKSAKKAEQHERSPRQNGKADARDQPQTYGANADCCGGGESPATGVGLPLSGDEAGIPDAPGRRAGLDRHDGGALCSSGGETRIAPPMLEWEHWETLEFIRAMRGFRRTRTYGLLYKLKKPEPEEIGEVVMCGYVRSTRRGYTYVPTLLESIPGDNFSGMSGAERWRALMRMLDPAGLAGAGTLGESLPRMSELAIS